MTIVKILKPVILILIFNQIVFTQTVSSRLFKQYDQYKESSFVNKRFKHKDILPLISKLDSNILQSREAGKSFENRSIFEVKYGNGPIKILLWSQMHGDEATATMALFDIFNFLSSSGDEFDTFRKELKEKTTIFFIPMLNPDGAEVFQRRTKQEIDMNRDALRLVCPESRLLKSLQQQYCPDFAFNLHDQNPRIVVGNTDKQSTLSFLASAYDHRKSINDIRQKAMQVIAVMNQEIQQFIPGQVSKYDDEHEPRAFGDNIQKWGSSLILIESGGYKNDSDKMFIRKLNFVSMLTAFESIFSGSYDNVDLSEYNKIPENNYKCYDILIKNVTISNRKRKYTIDIGINRTEVYNEEKSPKTYIRSNVAETGDISTYKGLEVWDAKGAMLGNTNGVPITVNVGQIANLRFWQGKELVKTLENGVLK
jgi:hypothetical protein